MDSLGILLVIAGLVICVPAAGAAAEEELGHAGTNNKASISNWCQLNTFSWVWQESFNMTRRIADAFSEGMHGTIALSSVVNTALEDMNLEGLDMISTSLIDWIETWIKEDIIQNLITQLVEVEAEIAVSIVTGTAVCDGLLQQVQSILTQLINHGVCCILCDAAFWNQVTELACGILQGLGVIVDTAGDKLARVTVESLTETLTNVILGFKNIILAAVELLAHKRVDHSIVVERALAVWTKSVLNAGFSQPCLNLVDELISHLSYIHSSTDSLVDWVLQSTCAVENTRNVIVFVMTDTINNLYDTFIRMTWTTMMQMQSAAAKFAKARATCDDFDDLIPSCASTAYLPNALFYPSIREENLVDVLLAGLYKTDA
ncbi:unnamed protein product [Notodromas monacha]|uniref:Uncharacterized protein n=1 Tax=Notodromas monacha TaxID=399045 RepID=A0A7R9BWI8_9CRUS|nr:unnamed protein product [Notodromas monacha]CAG0922696.1 unnamed protein product [Notodromas monacha]